MEMLDIKKSVSFNKGVSLTILFGHKEKCNHSEMQCFMLIDFFSAKMLEDFGACSNQFLVCPSIIVFIVYGVCMIFILFLKDYRIYPAIRRGFCPSRMTSNN